MHKEPLILETERLVLRKHRIEDYNRFWEMITDPIAKRFTGGVTSLTYDERFKLFNEDYSKSCSEDEIEFAVIEKSSMIYIGYCGCRISKELNGYELFYGYCRDSWGKGYGFEAADSAVSFFFDKIGIERLVAVSNKENISSVKILERLGFKILYRINSCEGIEMLDVYELNKQIK